MALQIGAAGMGGLIGAAVRLWSLALLMIVRRLDLSDHRGRVRASVRVMRCFASVRHAAKDCDEREEYSHSFRYKPSTTGMSHQSLHRHPRARTPARRMH
jgi:hypothetical protein